MATTAMQRSYRGTGVSPVTDWVVQMGSSFASWPSGIPG